MTTTKITLSQLIGLTHIDCVPVWKDDNIELFDMYTKAGEWIGSKRLLRYCKEEDDYIQRNRSSTC